MTIQTLLKQLRDAIDAYGPDYMHGLPKRTYLKQIDQAIAEAEKQEQGEPVAWVSFEDREPPIDSAFDDPEVKSVRSVLVTNNICSKDRMGRHSHVWFAAPIKNSKGKWVAYTDSSRKIEYLTHWLDPFTTPQQRKPLTMFDTEKLAKQCRVEWTNDVHRLCELAAAHSINKGEA